MFGLLDKLNPSLDPGVGAVTHGAQQPGMRARTHRRTADGPMRAVDGGELREPGTGWRSSSSQRSELEAWPARGAGAGGDQRPDVRPESERERRHSTRVRREKMTQGRWQLPQC